MTTIISTKQNNFKIYNEFNNNGPNSPHYVITIIINELKYKNEKYYYDISYDYNFIKSTILSDEVNGRLKKILHPFYETEEYLNSSGGDIIYKNPMITEMIKFLLMDDNELSLYSGSTTFQRYRIDIMKSLALFWD